MSTVEQQLIVEIELLKKDNEINRNLADKFDVAIVKLTAVADGMNRIIAVQEMRLESHDKQFDLWATQYENLNTKLNDAKDESRLARKEHHDALVAKLDKFEVTRVERDAVMSKRVETLERWKYIVVGATFAGGFILAKLLPFLTAIS